MGLKAYKGNLVGQSGVFFIDEKGEPVPVTKANPLPVTGAGGGSGDMLKEVYDPDDDGKVVAADSADSVPWTGVSGKPSSYPPSTHNHDTLYYKKAEMDTQIQNLQQQISALEERIALLEGGGGG